jgi:hypothetical protein
MTDFVTTPGRNGTTRRVVLSALEILIAVEAAALLIVMAWHV